MAGLERILDADQMAVISNANRPVLLLLRDHLPQANGDDVVPVIMVDCPVVEELPEQFGDAFLVLSTKVMEFMNLVKICAFSAINIQCICWFHGLQTW